MTIHQCKRTSGSCPVGEACRYCEPQEYIDQLLGLLGRIGLIVKAINGITPLQAGAWLLDK